MSDKAFLEAIEAEPANPLPRLVYADWLDERGNPRGELLRLQEELRSQNVPRRAVVEARMHVLLNAGVEPLTITRTTSVGMELVLIFPGRFVMGSPPDELGRSAVDLANEEQVEVELTQGFWLGRYPVTQAEWQQVMRGKPWQDAHDDFRHDVQDNATCPVVFVTPEDMIEFCQALTEQERQAELLPPQWECRLPTEAEWEYACRAGTTSRYSFGDDDSFLGDFAWFRENAHDFYEHYPHPVGQMLPNPWGLFDMHGNVWESCLTWHTEESLAASDPELMSTSPNLVERGGSWFNAAEYCRSASRLVGDIEHRSDNVGFRVARSHLG